MSVIAKAIAARAPTGTLPQPAGCGSAVAQVPRTMFSPAHRSTPGRPRCAQSPTPAPSPSTLV